MSRAVAVAGVPILAASDSESNHLGAHLSSSGVILGQSHSQRQYGVETRDQQKHGRSSSSGPFIFGQPQLAQNWE